MFDGKEQALAHRDAVLEVLVDQIDSDPTDQPFQIHPVLDGAVVKVANTDERTVQETFEDAGFPVEAVGEGPDGDWFEMKVLPKHD